jgi:hypothetical protein
MITVQLGHVRGPSGAAEVVLFDVPEMGYLHTDAPNNHGQPCMLNVADLPMWSKRLHKGYYKDEERRERLSTTKKDGSMVTLVFGDQMDRFRLSTEKKKHFQTLSRRIRRT